VKSAQAGGVVGTLRSEDGRKTFADQVLIASWVAGYAVLLQAFRLIKSLESRGNQGSGQ
jgi:hypothetical protein